MGKETGKDNIRPEDVPPSQAEKVLAFLNAAKTAKEIAEAVELPEEQDVGIKTAQNILDRRAGLGGFKNLTQVYEVTQVGPERFTEIVRTLGKGENSISRKMDGSMRRLLGTSDADIRKQYTREKRRLTRERQRIDETIPQLPATASEIDRQAVKRTKRIRYSELMPHRDLSAIIPDKLKPVRIRAIVRFTGNRSDLQSMGIEVRTQAQDVFTIVGTVDQLKKLVNRTSCRRLCTPRLLFPTVEDAAAQSEITAIHAPRSTDDNGFTGNGVIVGIIDSSPLDVTHHGFRDPEPDAVDLHESRVLYYWAQTTHYQNVGATVESVDPPGQTPQDYSTQDFDGLDYGRIYDSFYINTALATSESAPISAYGEGTTQICCEPSGNNEHGTHCAGIAAGSGHEADWNVSPVHIGAAPGAPIVYVRSKVLSWDIGIDVICEDDLLDGINFCLQAAEHHNMPIVISVSQGMSLGPHDGSGPFDQARDNLINSYSNRSIVWSAGNDNDDNAHRKGTVAANNSSDTFTLTAKKDWPLYLDVWYSGPELEVNLTCDDGQMVDWIEAGENFSGQIGLFNPQQAEVERDENGEGLRGIRFYFPDASSGDVYTIYLRNPDPTQAVNYHAWSGFQGSWADLADPTHNEATLSDTACCRSILTVGATGKIIPPDPSSGDLVTDYSGAGPTIDGRGKPEIVAVGGTSTNEIMSAASDLNSGYVGNHGTSMAAPLVAGAVACLFEEYTSAPPAGLGMELNQDAIKQLLTQYANRLNLHLDPSQPGYVPEEQNRYGYGRLRMIGPIDHGRIPVDNDVWVRTADDDYGEEPYAGGCFCHAPDVRVFEPGTDNETTSITWGTTYDVRVAVRNQGIQNAVDTTVRLKYTLPHAAPNEWFHAEDGNDNKLETTVNVPAMDSAEVSFSWCPEAAELNAPDGRVHFCLLAEVDNANDPLVYAAPDGGGIDAWMTNIKGTNNIALRNLHIE